MHFPISLDKLVLRIGTSHKSLWFCKNIYCLLLSLLRMQIGQAIWRMNHSPFHYEKWGNIIGVVWICFCLYVYMYIYTLKSELRPEIGR